MNRSFVKRPAPNTIKLLLIYTFFILIISSTYWLFLAFMIPLILFVYYLNYNGFFRIKFQHNLSITPRLSITLRFLQTFAKIIIPVSYFIFTSFVLIKLVNIALPHFNQISNMMTMGSFYVICSTLAAVITIIIGKTFHHIAQKEAEKEFNKDRGS